MLRGWGVGFISGVFCEATLSDRSLLFYLAQKNKTLTLHFIHYSLQPVKQGDGSVCTREFAWTLEVCNTCTVQKRAQQREAPEPRQRQPQCRCCKSNSCPQWKNQAFARGKSPLQLPDLLWQSGEQHIYSLGSGHEQTCWKPQDPLKWFLAYGTWTLRNPAASNIFLV